MAKGTRKDPRAKVLSMTVRYKSASVDDFIENHSHDVSLGGMFIKTGSPFPSGTLLKFEVKIADEFKVMQGVGRVVWKRDKGAATDDEPAGMGIKFIKIDQDSKKVIDKLVALRSDEDSAFEAGARQAGVSLAKSVPPVGTVPPVGRSMPPTQIQPSYRPEVAKIGLASAPPANSSDRPTTPNPDEAAASPGGSSFFPKSDPAEQPDPADRTVMRQAEELLASAIEGAGGSVDEVTSQSPPHSGKPAAEAAPVADQTSEQTEASSADQTTEPHDEREESGVTPTVAKESEAEDTDRESSTEARASDAPKSDVPKSDAPATSPLSQHPSSRAPSRPAPRKPDEAQEGGGSALWILAIVTVIGGAVFLVSQDKQDSTTAPIVEPEPPTAVEPTPAPKELPEPAAVEEPQQDEPEQADEEPIEDEADEESPTPAAPAAAAGGTTAAALQPSAAPQPTPKAPKPEPVVAPPSSPKTEGAAAPADTSKSTTSKTTAGTTRPAATSEQPKSPPAETTQPKPPSTSQPKKPAAPSPSPDENPY